MAREYQAYLMRFERSDAQSHWRVHVENTETGKILRFATEWELLRFLTQVLAMSSPNNGLRRRADQPLKPTGWPSRDTDQCPQA